MVGTNTDRQTAKLHLPFTVTGFGSSWGSDSSSAGSEGTYMVVERIYKTHLDGWWLMTACGWMALHYWPLTPDPWSPLHLNWALWGSESPLNQWNIQNLYMYHLAIHGSGCSPDLLTFLDVGLDMDWTWHLVSDWAPLHLTAQYKAHSSTYGTPQPLLESVNHHMVPTHKMNRPLLDMVLKSHIYKFKTRCSVYVL